jgi:hypothetical protein
VYRPQLAGVWGQVWSLPRRRPGTPRLAAGMLARLRRVVDPAEAIFSVDPDGMNSEGTETIPGGGIDLSQHIKYKSAPNYSSLELAGAFFQPIVNDVIDTFQLFGFGINSGTPYMVNINAYTYSINSLAEIGEGLYSLGKMSKFEIQMGLVMNLMAKYDQFVHGDVYKFGVTDALGLRFRRSKKMAGPGATGKISRVMPKYKAHILEKYLRTVYYNSTGQWNLPGMKVTYPINFDTGKRLVRP